MSVPSELHPRGGNASGAFSGGGTGCPDWRRLVAERDEQRADPLGWTEALRHLDGCVRCREAALAADPLLLFRRLPRVAASPAAASAGEITIDVEAMKRGVATLRRTSALQGGASAPAREIRRLRRRLSLAAATVLMVVTAGLSPVSAPSPQPSLNAGMDPRTVAGVEASGFEASGFEASGSLLLAPAGSLFEAAGYEAFGGGVAGAWDEPQILAPTASSIEDLDLPNSRVYQIAGDDVAIAMIFNQSFDV